MPVYVYETIRDDGQPGERFETRQGIHDAALTHHPDTGEPISCVDRRPPIQLIEARPPLSGLLAPLPAPAPPWGVLG